LVSEPVAVDATPTTTVYVAVAPAAMVAVVAIGIEPDEAPQIAPEVEAQVHEPEAAPAGNESVIDAPTAVDGPAFPTTTAYDVVCPGTTDDTPSVFVIERSAVGFKVSVSVDELLASAESVMPAGAVIEALFTSVPVAVGTTVADTVNVAAAPTGRSTVVAMLPLPLPAEHDPPPDGTHTHVDAVSAPGSESAIAAAVTADGPALPATIVYVADVPGTSVATPSVFTMDTSAVGVNVSVSVAELLAAVGSVTPAGGAMLALLTSVPVADGTTTPVTVNVTEPPTGSVTDALMLPLPLVGHVPPAVPAHVHETPLSVAGIVSATVAPVTADGPAFVATIE
jgi:hypothetical protein